MSSLNKKPEVVKSFTSLELASNGRNGFEHLAVFKRAVTVSRSLEGFILERNRRAQTASKTKPVFKTIFVSVRKNRYVVQ